MHALLTRYVYEFDAVNSDHLLKLLLKTTAGARLGVLLLNMNPGD